MKKTASLLPIAAISAMLILASCGKEEEPEPVTVPGINGTWSLSENSQDYGGSSYNVTISDSSDASHKLIAYLYGFSKKIYGTFSGSSLVIPVQLVEGNNVSGRGTVANANRLNLTYWVQSSTSHTDTVTAVLTK